MGGTCYQRRRAHGSTGSKLATHRDTAPVKSIPLEKNEVTGAAVRDSWHEDTKRSLADFLEKALQDYEKQQAPKLAERQEEEAVSRFKRPKAKAADKTTEANYIKVKRPAEPSADVGYITIGTFPPFHPAFLRDSCECGQCVDPSSRQKNFQTTDIPKDIKAGTLNISQDGFVEIIWENDVPGFPPGHKSVFSKEFFKTHSHPVAQTKARFEVKDRTLWNKDTIRKELEYVDYEEYMNTDEGLYRAIRNLHSHGLLLVRGVPESEKSVEEIATRIGNLRDTLYGRTWDVRMLQWFHINETSLTVPQVRSVPQAKNVAYTAQFLGLHMDLLYMSDPPGFQFLHCLQNTCEGGSSLFSDAMYAASKLSTDSFSKLAKLKLAYHYKNAGEHYYFRHPIIQVPPTYFDQSDKSGRAIMHDANRIQFINYSPPFQANQ